MPSSAAAGGGAGSAAGVYGPGAGAAAAAAAASASTTPRVGGGAGSVRKKRRWDDGTPVAGGAADGDETPAAGGSGKAAVSDWDADVATPVRSSRGFGGGETPGRTPGGGGETPGRGSSRWDQTPSRDAQETPVSRRSSRWDQSGGVTPVAGGVTPGVTPGGVGDTPKAGSKWDDETPRAGGGFGAGETPSGRKKSRWDQVGGPFLYDFLLVRVGRFIVCCVRCDFAVGWMGLEGTAMRACFGIEFEHRKNVTGGRSFQYSYFFFRSPPRNTGHMFFRLLLCVAFSFIDGTKQETEEWIPKKKCPKN